MLSEAKSRLCGNKRIQQFKDSKIQGFKDSKIQDLLIYAFKDVVI